MTIKTKVMCDCGAVTTKKVKGKFICKKCKNGKKTRKSKRRPWRYT